MDPSPVAESAPRAPGGGRPADGSDPTVPCVTSSMCSDIPAAQERPPSIPGLRRALSAAAQQQHPGIGSPMGSSQPPFPGVTSGSVSERFVSDVSMFDGARHRIRAKSSPPAGSASAASGAQEHVPAPAAPVAVAARPHRIHGTPGKWQCVVCHRSPVRK